MKVDFSIEIKEYKTREPNSWIVKYATVRIEASKDTIDKIVEALKTVPDLEIK